MRIRTGLAAGVLAVALAGCGTDGDGGDGVASAGGAVSTTSARKGPGDPVRFAQCMRDHGVDMVDPDETGGGPIEMTGGVDTVDVDAAMKECGQFAPDDGEPTKLDAAQQEQLRKMSQCMRDNGVANFPDPDPEGGIRIDLQPGAGLDMDDPTFRAATEKCGQSSPIRPSASIKQGG